MFTNAREGHTIFISIIISLKIIYKFFVFEMKLCVVYNDYNTGTRLETKVSRRRKSAYLSLRPQTKENCKRKTMTRNAWIIFNVLFVLWALIFCPRRTDSFIIFLTKPHFLSSFQFFRKLYRQTHSLFCRTCCLHKNINLLASSCVFFSDMLMR